MESDKDKYKVVLIKPFIMKAGSNNPINRLLDDLKCILGVESKKYVSPPGYKELEFFDTERFSKQYEYKKIPKEFSSTLEEKNAKVDSIKVSILGEGEWGNPCNGCMCFVITITILINRNVNLDIGELKSQLWRIYGGAGRLFDCLRLTEELKPGLDRIKYGVWNSTFYCSFIPFDGNYDDFKTEINASEPDVLSMLYGPDHPHILKGMENLWHDDEFHVHSMSEFTICPYMTCGKRKELYISAVIDCFERFAIFLLITEKLQGGCHKCTKELSDMVTNISKLLEKGGVEKIIKRDVLKIINNNRLSSVDKMLQYTKVITTLDDEIMKSGWAPIYNIIDTIKKDLNFYKRNEIIEKEINSTHTAANELFDVLSSEIEYSMKEAIKIFQYIFIFLGIATIVISVFVAAPLFKYDYAQEFTPWCMLVMCVVILHILAFILISIYYLLRRFIGHKINRWQLKKQQRKGEKTIPITSISFFH